MLRKLLDGHALALSGQRGVGAGRELLLECFHVQFHDFLLQLLLLELRLEVLNLVLLRLQLFLLVGRIVLQRLDQVLCLIVFLADPVVVQLELLLPVLERVEVLPAFGLQLLLILVQLLNLVAQLLQLALEQRLVFLVHLFRLFYLRFFDLELVRKIYDVQLLLLDYLLVLALHPVLDDALHLLNCLLLLGPVLLELLALLLQLVLVLIRGVPDQVVLSLVLVFGLRQLHLQPRDFVLVRGQLLFVLVGRRFRSPLLLELPIF